AREASHARVHLPRSADQTGEHAGVVPRAQACGYRRLPLARSAPYVGELARAERHTALRVTRTRWLGDREDGSSLCAPGCGPSGDTCREHGNSRHNYGTTTGFPRHTQIASRRKIRDLLVARGGIEPPTRGFSV